MQYKKKFPIILLYLPIILIIVGYVGYVKFQPTSQILTIPSVISVPPSSSPPTEIIAPITQDELIDGWYWGLASQKKPGTPDSWLFKDAGRSSCWHNPENSCEPDPNLTP